MLLVTSSLAATVPSRWVELDSHEKWNLEYTLYTRNFYHDRLMIGIKRTTTNCMIQIPSSKQPPKMNGEVKKVDRTQWSLSLPELFLFQVPCCIFNSKVFESTPCPPTRVTIEFPMIFPFDHSPSLSCFFGLGSKPLVLQFSHISGQFPIGSGMLEADRYASQTIHIRKKALPRQLAAYESTKPLISNNVFCASSI